VKRSVLAALAVLTAAVLIGGCGSGSNGGSGSTAPKKATAPNAPAGSKVVSCDGSAQLRATEVDCATAHMTMDQWAQRPDCALGESDSRGSCALGQFRCQAVKVDAGISVTCAGPEGVVSFIARPAG
jgi:hypothetical protein